MMEITRGTTPTLTLGLPFDAALIDVGFVTIQQQGKTVLEKSFDDCECKDNELLVTRTQAETLKLSHLFRATIRLVIKTVDGERYESKPIVIHVADTSKDGAI